MRTGAKVYYRKFLTCSQRPSHELLVAPGKKLLVARSYERSSWHYYYSSKKLFGRGFPTTTRSITGMTTNVTPDITHDIRPKPWASWSFFGTMRAPGRTSSTRSVLRPRREECAARHVGKIRSSSCPGEVVLGGGRCGHGVPVFLFFRETYPVGPSKYWAFGDSELGSVELPSAIPGGGASRRPTGAWPVCACCCEDAHVASRGR